MQLKYFESLVDSSEMVGILAAQSIGEPSTQMTLNTFHLAGFGERNVTLGIPRLREILMTDGSKIKTPDMRFWIKRDSQAPMDDAIQLKYALDPLPLSKLVVNRHIVGPHVDTTTKKPQRIYKIEVEVVNPKEFHIPATAIVRSVLNKFFSTLLRLVADAADIKSIKIDEAEIAGEDGEENENEIEEAMQEESDNEEPSKSKDVEEDGKRKEKKKTNKKAGRRNKTSDEQDSDDSSESEENTSDSDKSEKNASDTELSDDNTDNNAKRKQKKSTQISKQKQTQNKSVERKESHSEEEDTDAYSPKTLPSSSDYDKVPNLVTSDSGGEEVSMSATEKDKVVTKMKECINKEQELKEKQQIFLFSFRCLFSKKKKKEQKYIKIYIIITVVNKRHISIFVDIQLPMEAQQILIDSILDRVCEKEVFIRKIPNIEEVHIEYDKKGCSKSPSEMKWKVNISGFNPTVIRHVDKWVDIGTFESNHINAIYCLYGIEAARASIINELRSVLSVYGLDVSYRHYSLIADSMCFDGHIRPMTRTSMGQSASPFLKISYETATKYLIDSCLMNHIDGIASPSSAIVLGQVGRFGTGMFDVKLDLKENEGMKRKNCDDRQYNEQANYNNNRDRYDNVNEFEIEMSYFVASDMFLLFVLFLMKKQKFFSKKDDNR
ncbi:DNA directed RNA polymerase [Reticulomyxa filosa]|uniref:DNA-directed RNA polymerase n=1 Tax=Reticulomyxa filosa TaxID=46433 RepID=X6P8N1_RETFI|nr:DNA directed RNA polymerase [Reticulomyxa filosa]|eukprot:ETO34012.1 DNA directed RNA polymerase [Reticulomyxa filosa]